MSQRPLLAVTHDLVVVDPPASRNEAVIVIPVVVAPPVAESCTRTMAFQRLLVAFVDRSDRAELRLCATVVVVVVGGMVVVVVVVVVVGGMVVVVVVVVVGAVVGATVVVVAGGAVMLVVLACCWRAPLASYWIRLTGWPILLDDCWKYERAPLFSPPTAETATRTKHPKKRTYSTIVTPCSPRARRCRFLCARAIEGLLSRTHMSSANLPAN